MTCAGLKKCIPTTSSGREVTFAQSMTGSEDVVVASTAPGLQMRSRSRKRSCLTSRSSAIASTTRSASASASRVVLPVSRPSTDSASSAVIRPFSTARAAERATAARTPSTLSSPRAT